MLSSECRQNPKTLIRLQKPQNSKFHNPVNRKLASAQTVRFTGGLFQFEFLTISFVWKATFWILPLCQQPGVEYIYICLAFFKVNKFLIDIFLYYIINKRLVYPR